MRRTLHPDIEVHTSAEVGEEGTYRGPDGFDRWVAVWLEAWEEFRTEVQEVEEVDDRNVLVHVNQWGRGRDSGLRVDRTVTFLVTVQDGKTTRLHIYGDREAAPPRRPGMNNVELARRGFEAFNRGDMETVVDFLHPDVEVHSVAEVGGHVSRPGRVSPLEPDVDGSLGDLPGRA